MVSITMPTMQTPTTTVEVQFGPTTTTRSSLCALHTQRAPTGNQLVSTFTDARGTPDGSKNRAGTPRSEHTSRSLSPTAVPQSAKNARSATTTNAQHPETLLATAH